MSSSERRAALVTGAARGIGRAVARRLLRAGYAVVLGDVDEPTGNAVAADLAEFGVARFQPLDVADEDSVAAAVADTVERFGSLDALVNNAAESDPDNGPVEELSLGAWERRLRVNLTGAFLGAKHAAPHLRRARGGLVNIASTRALQSEPHCEAYAASKGALVALTHALAVSLGPEVRVNCVSPGWIDTRAWQQVGEAAPVPPLAPEDHAQHPAGRVGRPEDVADAVAWLLGSESGFVTGHNLVVDGGMTRRMIYAE